jgi:hypothetical protein
MPDSSRFLPRKKPTKPEFVARFLGTSLAKRERHPRAPPSGAYGHSLTKRRNSCSPSQTPQPHYVPQSLQVLLSAS